MVGLCKIWMTYARLESFTFGRHILLETIPADHLLHREIFWSLRYRHGRPCWILVAVKVCFLVVTYRHWLVATSSGRARTWQMYMDLIVTKLVVGKRSTAG